MVNWWLLGFLIFCHMLSALFISCKLRSSASPVVFVLIEEAMILDIKTGLGVKSALSKRSLSHWRQNMNTITWVSLILAGLQSCLFLEDITSIRVSKFHTRPGSLLH